MDPKISVTIAAFLLPFIIYGVYVVANHYLSGRKNSAPLVKRVEATGAETAEAADATIPANTDEGDFVAGDGEASSELEHEPQEQEQSIAAEQSKETDQESPSSDAGSDAKSQIKESQDQKSNRKRPKKKRQLRLERFFTRNKRRSEPRTPLSATRRQEPGFASTGTSGNAEFEETGPLLPPMKDSTDDFEEAGSADELQKPKIVRRPDPEIEDSDLIDDQVAARSEDAADTPTETTEDGTDEKERIESLDSSLTEEEEYLADKLLAKDHVQQTQDGLQVDAVASESAETESSQSVSGASELEQAAEPPAAGGDSQSQVASPVSAEEPQKEDSGEVGNEPDDSFPEIGDAIDEYFYYTARMTIPDGMLGSQTLKLAKQIVKSSNLDRQQELLGYVPALGAWEKPRQDKLYEHVVWAAPLTGRQSRITNEEMVEFVRIINDQMRRSKGNVRFMGHQDVQERLAKVEEFCNEVDLGINLTLVAKEGRGDPQRASSIIELLQAEKLEEVKGDLLRSCNGEIWYRVFAGENEQLGRKPPDRRLARLRLYMDVPHVRKYEAAYDEMMQLGMKLARVLDFVMIDEQGNEFELDEIEETKTHFLRICEHMIDQGVKPGSKLARALFS